MSSEKALLLQWCPRAAVRRHMGQCDLENRAATQGQFPEAAGASGEQELVGCTMLLPLSGHPGFGPVVVPCQVMAAAVLPSFMGRLREQDGQGGGWCKLSIFRFPYLPPRAVVEDLSHVILAPVDRVWVVLGKL